MLTPYRRVDPPGPMLPRLERQNGRRAANADDHLVDLAFVKVAGRLAQAKAVGGGVVERCSNPMLPHDGACSVGHAPSWPG